MKISNTMHKTKTGQIKHNPNKLSAEDKYFKNYFDETSKVNGYDEFAEKGNNFYEYNFTNKDLIKIFQSFSIPDKRKIRYTMVQIDFKNGDMQHFVDYLMKGYTKNQRGEKL